METEEAEQEPPAIQDRTDSGGPWSAAGPLLAMALIGLMLIHACVPTRATVGPAPAATMSR